MLIDTGDQTRLCYEMICKMGWLGLVGSDKTSFSEIINQERIARPFARIMNGDPFSGRVKSSKEGWKWRLAPVWRWSNPTIKDILSNLLKSDGFVADDVPQVWREHINAERKVSVKNPMTGRTRLVWKQIGKDNHLLDCECMNIVGASLHKLLNISPASLTDEVENNGEG